MDKNNKKDQLLNPEVVKAQEFAQTESKPTKQAMNKPVTIAIPEVVVKEKVLPIVKNKSQIVKQKTTITQPTDLPKTIFNIKVNNQVMFDAVLSERASRRQGTHKVKDRGEVRGGGRKPWRQKGTGRARAGSIRSPIWVGGGVAFGPTPERNYTLKINKKARKLALNSALSLKAAAQAILVHDFKLEKPSTKELLNQIEQLNLNQNWKKLLIINDSEIVFKSAQNVKTLKVNKVTSLSIETILNADAIIFTHNSLERLVK